MTLALTRKGDSSSHVGISSCDSKQYTGVEATMESAGAFLGQICEEEQVRLETELRGPDHLHRV